MTESIKLRVESLPICNGAMNIGRSLILLERVGISEQSRCPIRSRPRLICGSSPPAYQPGGLFRCVCRAGKCWGVGVTERVVWHVVKDYAKRSVWAKLPHTTFVAMPNPGLCRVSPQ